MTVTVMFVSLLLFASLSLSLPAPDKKTSDGTFSIPRSRKERYTRDGAAALAQVYRKYGWTLPTAGVVASVDIATTGPQFGSVNASPQPYHSEYLSPVTIGGQTLDMDFDTGSSDLWVFSTYMSEAAIGNHTAFNPNKSSTFEPMPKQRWFLKYGDGSSASGLVGRDTVVVGGATVTCQAVEMATAVASQFESDTANDGILGLGFSSLNSVRPKQQLTFFDNIRSSLLRPLFAVDLREDGSGAYHFGTVPLGTYKPPITRVNVNNTQGYWQFAAHQVAVRGTTTNRPNSSPAIADTGTSLLIVDDAVIVAFYGAIAGAGFSRYYGGYVFPCAGDIPDLVLTVGGPLAGNRTVTVPAALLTYAPLTEGYCYGSVQSNAGYPLQIYGDVFFRAAYVVFYREGLPSGPQLGIADKA